jgi:hypothetical protein
MKIPYPRSLSEKRQKKKKKKKKKKKQRKEKKETISYVDLWTRSTEGDNLPRPLWGTSRGNFFHER